MNSIEAEMGAWMEGIEFAKSEPGASPLKTVFRLREEILDGRNRPDAYLDFCPYLDAQFPSDRRIPCIQVKDYFGGDEFYIPAERVFVPAPPEVESPLYGYSTTGIAAGLTRLEAMIHGLMEVLERDIISYQLVKDRSCLVEEQTWPAPGRALWKTIASAGKRLHVRYLENPYRLPCFHATLEDPEDESIMLVNGGYACHPDRERALVRAILEAVQSRLSVIHGGRDDLIEAKNTLRNRTAQQLQQDREQLIEKARNRGGFLSYLEIPDYQEHIPAPSEVWSFLCEKVKAEGLRYLFIVPFTDEESPVQVVKVVVPGTEEFAFNNPRLGKRLMTWLNP